MSAYTTYINQLTQNLNALLKHKACYAGNAPLDLLNAIEDHHDAINLTESALNGALDEEEWRDRMNVFLKGLAAHFDEESGELIITNVETMLDGLPRPEMTRDSIPANSQKAQKKPPLWRWIATAVGLVMLLGGIIGPLFLRRNNAPPTEMVQPDAPFSEQPGSSTEELEDAVTFYTALIEDNPTNIEAYINRASAYYYLDNVSAAQADLQQALNLSNDPDLSQAIEAILQELEANK